MNMSNVMIFNNASMKSDLAAWKKAYHQKDADLKAMTSAMEKYKDALETLRPVYDKVLRDLQIQQAYTEAFSDQMHAVIAELKRVDPNNKLFQRGDVEFRIGPNKGVKKSMMRRIFDAGFDRICAKFGISNPEQIRDSK